MSSKHRYVFDTNAVVSAFLFEKSEPGRALLAALEHGQLLLSAQVATELSEVLRREKFDRYLSRQKRERLLKSLIQESLLVEVTESVTVCRDPKDNKYLDLAIIGEANCIVSGDEDLLVLNPFRGIPILRPAGFLVWLSS